MPDKVEVVLNEDAVNAVRESAIDSVLEVLMPMINSADQDRLMQWAFDNLKEDTHSKWRLLNQCK